MGRLLRILVILAILAVGVDFGARLVVEDRAEGALEQRNYLGAGSFEIEVDDFPFLWNLAQGTFPQVVITGTDVHTEQADLEWARLDLRDAEWSFPDERDSPDLLVRARSGRGVAALSSEGLTALLADTADVEVELLQDEMRIASAEGEATVAEDAITIEPDDGAGSLRVDAPSPVGPLVAPLPELVEGMEMRSAEIQRGELRLSFSLDRVELGLPSIIRT
jgi:hypothetical protein